jgi:hypothetical protein
MPLVFEKKDSSLFSTVMITGQFTSTSERVTVKRFQRRGFDRAQGVFRDEGSGPRKSARTCGRKQTDYYPEVA